MYLPNVVYNILWRVAKFPERVEDLVRLVYVLIQTVFEHVLDEERVRLVAYLEHVSTVHDTVTLGYVI